MQIHVATPVDYISQIPPERLEAFTLLRETILKNLPKGFSEIMIYGMIGYVVPHEIYPKGYHCDPKIPLPFMSIASQKNFIAFYHMGIYGDKKLLDWFVAEYANYSKNKPDMGKSCIRFKKPQDIPHKLIGELVAKVSCSEWIAHYEKYMERR